MLRLSTQCRLYNEFSIPLVHGVVTLQPKKFNLHVSIKVGLHLEIIMNERQPVGSVWCQSMCQSRTFPIEDNKSHGFAPTGCAIDVYRGGDLGEDWGTVPLKNLRWGTAHALVPPIFREVVLSG